MLKRIWYLFRARNLEFLRDKSSLGWNIILPVLLIFGLSYVFSGDGKAQYTVITNDAETSDVFLETKYINFVETDTLDSFQNKLSRHQVDMLIDTQEYKYWVNDTSPKGYFLEKILKGSTQHTYEKGTISGDAITYADWVLPGILGMNMMFSCLFGVGYVIVRYRKSGYLKRLNATPLSAFEFIVAQVFSRLILIMAITSVVFIGTKYTIGVAMNGSYLLLFGFTFLGAMSMISLGLVISARVTSEELAGGLLNLVSWPMMVLSNVWFSIEGAPRAIQIAAECMPLTQLMNGVRAIMIDGAGLAEIAYPATILAIMTIVFLFTAASVFKWNKE